MDDDDLRRGKPTSHKVFGEAIAILAGDALLTRAFHLLAEIPEGWDAEARCAGGSRATAILGEACGTTGLIGGQVMDLESEGRAIGARRPRAPAPREDGRAPLRLRARRRDPRRRERGGPRAALPLRLRDRPRLPGRRRRARRDGGRGARSARPRARTRRRGKATYVSVHGLERRGRWRRRCGEEALDAVAPLGPRGELLAAIARLIVDRHS